MTDKRDIEKFAEEVRREFRLADDFAKAIVRIARQAGYNVSEGDVLEYFVDAPAALRNPQKEARLSTMAVGEEEPRPRPLPKDDGAKFTTMAMGEEGKKPNLPKRGR